MLLFLLLMFQTPLFAQDAPKTEKTALLQGTIWKDGNQPLPNVSVLVEGTDMTAVSDEKGNYKLALTPGVHIVVVSLIGYRRKEVKIKIADEEVKTTYFILYSDTKLNQMVSIGSKSKPKTLLQTALAIDIIDNQKLQQTPQLGLSQILQYNSPSIHSSSQNISDGTDHIDPVTLRGLGADQMLVLINGKRRHATSLMNVNGTIGRGQVGTDLNAIPTSMIERIEVLRDGAAAQYGSDAIAGVINVILKKDANMGEINLQGGLTLDGLTQQGGGENAQVNANYGFQLQRGGFINLSLDFSKTLAINRSGEYTGTIFGDSRDNDPIATNAFFNQSDPKAIDAYNLAYGLQYGLANTNKQNDFHGNRVMNIGAAGNTRAGLFFNSEMPLNPTTDFYAFGGFSYKKGEATGFYRFPKQEARQSGIWNLGFSPNLQSDILDISAAVGVRSNFKNWFIDFSNTFGSNSFDWTISNSNNASMGLTSPSSFYAGGLRYTQNVTNLDLSRKVKLGIPFNIAFGGEFRLENFQQVAGQAESWGFYGDTTSTGATKEAGSQVFPGYRDINNINKFRFNTGLYADIEANITKNWLVALAGRFEQYSDFGPNFSWKVASRYNITKDITVRAAYSTGFRAPSLPQKFFSSNAVQFINTGTGLEAVDVGHFNEESVIKRQFGIENLQPETSSNVSFGASARLFKMLSLTVDGYLIDIKNRIGITGRFAASDDPRFANILNPAGVNEAQFMTNAVDTRTMGIDFSAFFNVPMPLNTGYLTLNVAGNFSQTKVRSNENGEKIINTGTFLTGYEDKLFNREEISRLETAQPGTKLMAGIHYEIKSFEVILKLTRFGEVMYVAPSATPVLNELTGQVESLDQVFSAKWVLDVDLAYNITRNIKVSLGGMNVTNTYPDAHTHSANISDGLFTYSRRVSQIGLAGAQFYARLKFKF